MQPCVFDERVADRGGQAGCATGVERVVVDRFSAISLKAGSGGAHQGNDSSAPPGIGERGGRVGEYVRDHALGMIQPVTQREGRAQRLATDQPSVDVEELPQSLEVRDISLWCVEAGIVRRRRPPVTEQLDDNRTAERRECWHVSEPLRAAGEHAVDEEQMRSPGAVNVVVKERLAHYDLQWSVARFCWVKVIPSDSGMVWGTIRMDYLRVNGARPA